MVGNMIGKYRAEIAQALPSVITPERFTRIATNAIATNPKMIQAVTESPKSLIGALMTCAQLGIEPNTPLGQGYLLPFYNFDKTLGKKVMQISFQLGYMGVIDLCYRSGEVTMIQAHEVYEKDYFEYELGLDPKLKHIPHRGADRGDMIYVYAMFKTKTGATGFACMSKEEIEEHAKRFSKSYDYKTGKFFGPWETDFVAMAKKTVLLQALKYAPKKSDFARAIVSDNTVKSELAKDMSEVQNEVIEADVVENGGADKEEVDAKPSEEQPKTEEKQGMLV
ncbi:MAG: recombinase RecT [Bacteroidales bacterium]|nr:recombinase RecT [Bacteroidales bacterium]